MALVDVLRSAYQQMNRSVGQPIPAEVDARIVGIASSVQPGGFYDPASALRDVAMIAENTLGVAVASYQFFTGAAPRLGGLDYLISPTGPNPANLNSAYYAQFNTANRHINFAVNLGRYGEGAAAFNAEYGALSLSAAIVKAYHEIFGRDPAPSQVEAFIGDQVSNGRGGTYTRAEYLAEAANDTVTGIGTKAAYVGWLLSFATESRIGFLMDMADGTAAFEKDVYAAYGPGGDYAATGILAPTHPGYELDVGVNDNVGRFRPTIVFPGTVPPTQYSSSAGDVIVGTSGFAGGVLADAGNDTITVTGGAMSGGLYGQDGNDTITVSQMDGIISTGQGYDRVGIGGFGPLRLDGAGKVTGAAEITDFTDGKDSLTFAASQGPGAKLVALGADFDAALALISAATLAETNAVFEFEGSTWVYHQNGVAGVDAGDGLIKLAGVTGLTVANGTGAGDIHFG